MPAELIAASLRERIAHLSAAEDDPDCERLERASRLIDDQLAEDALDDADRRAWLKLANLITDTLMRGRAGRDAQSGLLNRIENAITRRRFRVVYQPIVDLASGDTIGLEALSRFCESDPNRWFADAANVGLRTVLELTAIDEAVHSGAFDRLPPDGFLSVNASPSAIMSPLLRQVLDGLDLGRIVIELTEDTPIEQPDALHAALRPLRDHGLRLAVDDTGAGYASLKLILQLRPDLIKFDRFFVTDIENDLARRALFAASVEFALALGSRVVAEGVETSEQLTVLKQLGVHLAQGYLLGRPRELEEMPTMAMATTPIEASA